jgi:hypothetical protein
MGSRLGGRLGRLLDSGSRGNCLHRESGSADKKCRLRRVSFLDINCDLAELYKRREVNMRISCNKREVPSINIAKTA